MNKRIISAALSLAMTVSVCSGMAVTTALADGEAQYSTTRCMEKLNRGLVAVKTTANTANNIQGGVYLSWRLLGDEPLATQEYDIYKNGTKLTTTTGVGSTTYLDASGTISDKYVVVKAGLSGKELEDELKMAVTPYANNYTAKDSEARSGNSEKNSYTYVDVPIERPADVARMGDGKTSVYYATDSNAEGGANDASVGDLDGDGDYELVLKWNPNDAKDSAGSDFTGNVYIDAYEIDPVEHAADKAETGHEYKWRIDLGKNVTAGAHYTQFIVYDFDGDGRSEIAMKTAPGTKDGLGEYVTRVGDTPKIINTDNEKSYIGTSGRLKGKNPFTQFLTVFDGETGEALATTEYIPYEGQGYWGDPSAKYNRSERYLAAVAYIDGVTPSIVMCRGYYHNAVVRTYTFDGDTITLQAEHNANSRANDNIFGQGNHNLSVADIDNDGCDEIVYGSVSLDFIKQADGSYKTVGVGNTKLGHGDAMHVSDFNNDGNQEVFSVKEDGEGYKKYAMDLRNAFTGQHAWNEGVHITSGDNGRGVMANVDDAYAQAHPDTGLAIGWSSGLSYAVDLKGNNIGAKPGGAGKGSFDNFFVYWDGDLGRELLDANIIQKYDVTNGWTKRFYGPSDGYTLSGQTSNSTKRNYALVADLWGDWREEIIMKVGTGKSEKPALRIFTSTLPTQYRLTTLMHDCQYREAIAWQNVAYNQPPHTSYYIGSAALKSGKNYLDPEVPFTEVTYPDNSNIINVSDLQITYDGTPVEELEDPISVERGHTESVVAQVLPENARKKGIKWTSANEDIATVSNGIIRGISKGTVKITAETKGVTDSGSKLTKEFEVEVWSTDVESVMLSENMISVAEEGVKQLNASVFPENASVQTVKWRSSKESVATVSDEGLVTGISTGVATIYVKTDDKGFEEACVVNVVPSGATDITGSDTFTTDDNPSYMQGASATGATLDQTKGAENGGEIHKDFEVVTKDRARVELNFTTGGNSLVGTGTVDDPNDSSKKWGWLDHEYTMSLAFLDEDGNNILTVSQPYEAKAGELLSKTVNDAPVSFSSAWSVVNDNDKLGNVQGSSKRWKVRLDLDYETKTCKARISGTDGSFSTIDGDYEITFDIGDAHFKTIKCYTTKDGNGVIKANPKIQDVVYKKIEPMVGASSDIYKRGSKTGIEWSNADVSDWTTTGTSDAITLGIDKTNGLMFNPTQPTSSYSASKTFDVSDTATLTYNIDWHFGNATNRYINREYLQIGSDLRLGWMSKDSKKNGIYCLLLSKDGGKTYEGYDADADEKDMAAVDETKTLLTGKGVYTKNVQVVIDTATKTVTSFKFAGQTIDLGSEPLTMSEINYVTFGLDRGGSTEQWEYPNGLTNITVSQFEKDAVPMFDIKFVNPDGKVLQSERLKYGEIPEYKGNPPTMASTATKEYTFKGTWQPAEFKPVVDNVTYVAQYDENLRSYNIDFNPNGGTLNADVPESYVSGDEVILPTGNQITREGYKFIGWYDNERLTGQPVGKIIATDTGDKTFYAKWTATEGQLDITSVSGNQADVEFTLMQSYEYGVDVIGALYDGNKLVEAKIEYVSEVLAKSKSEAHFTFEHNAEDYDLRVYVWEYLNDMMPVFQGHAEHRKTVTN